MKYCYWIKVAELKNKEIVILSHKIIIDLDLV